jgi:hypothetical protein
LRPFRQVLLRDFLNYRLTHNSPALP